MSFLSSPKKDRLKNKLFLLAIAALALRLVLAIPFRSDDLVIPAIWGIYAKDFGFSGYYDFLNFGNYSRPDYPPLSIVMFWVIRISWQWIFNLAWYFNTTLPAFPSGFITWLEGGGAMYGEGYIYLLKLPGLFADYAIGWVVYSYAQRFVSKQKALLFASLYWFNPAAIYVNSMWGQIDGLVVLVGLLAIISLERKRTIPGLLFYTISILLKGTLLTLVPLVMYLTLKNKDWKGTLTGAALSLLLVFYISSVFTDSEPLKWFVESYIDKFSKSATHLPYIHLLAYNFWGMITAFKFVRDDVVFGPFMLSDWGRILTILSIVISAMVATKKKNHWALGIFLIFFSFLFLPRMHERYLLPILPFLLILCIRQKKYLTAFISMTILQTFNLYGAWQVPNSFVAQLFSSSFFVRIGSIFMLSLAGYLLINVARGKELKTTNG